jgi:hypothetical protein
MTHSMSASHNSVAPTSGESIRHEAIIDWLEGVKACVAESSSAELLDMDGVDAIDALTSELYLTTLGTLRSGPASMPTWTSTAYEAARHLAYRIKRRLIEAAARQHSAPPREADILFWPRDVTHTKVLAPVGYALGMLGVSSQFLACQPSSVDRIWEQGIAPIYTLSTWPARVRQARRNGARRARRLARSRPWRLPDLGSVPGDYLEPSVRSVVVRSMPIVAEAVANAREALRRVRPRVLVVGNDLTLEGCVGCRVAAQSGVSTAVFMHGTITGIPMQAHHPANLIYVYGDAHRLELLERGISDARIVVCGNPSMDSRSRLRGKTHPQLKARLGLRDDTPWILVATSGPGHRVSHAHHATLITNLSELARAFPKVPVVIKLHRKDRLEYYASILKASGDLPLHIIPHDVAGFPSDIFDWLQGCSMILTGASTTAIEAMALDIPVITMDYCNELYSIDFIDAGATLHVTDASGLVDAVKKILSTGRLPTNVQQRAMEFLKGTYFALDGKSSQRAAESLRHLATREV